MVLKVLDRYICSIILKYFGVGFLGFFCLYSFIDLISKLFRFSKNGRDIDFTSISLYYIYAIPDLFSLTCPFIFCLSCFFALARLQSNSQIIAIMAAGVSMKRISRSMLLLSIGLSLFLMVFNNDLKALGLRKRVIFEKPEVYSSNNSSYDSSFQDLIVFEDKQYDKLLNFERYIDYIDIENLQLSTGTSDHFHATFFNSQMVPQLKLFAKRINVINNSNWIKLNQGYLVPITGEIRKIKKVEFENIKVKLRVPLKITRFSDKNIEVLKNNELKFFIKRVEVLAEYFFRYINSMLPTIMFIISISLALPFLYQKPIYSYFTCLISCLMMFFLTIYLRSQAENGYLAPITAGVILIIITSLVYIFYGRKTLER